MNAQACLKIAGIAGATGVAAGAFGAHGLQGRIPENLIEIFHTGANYHLLHSIVLLALSALVQQFQENKFLLLSAHFFWFGILVFSGSLYILALSGARWWGAVTPIGGMSLIIGWILLFIAAKATKKTGTSQHNQS